ncbi:MAG: alanine racemase [Bacteroidota bacterium]
MNKGEELIWTLERVAAVCPNSRWLSKEASLNIPIEEWVYDTRRCSSPGKAVFLALSGQGPNARNGHQYLEQAYTVGIRNFVVDQEQTPEMIKLAGASVLVVPKVLTALQAVAAEHRRQWGRPLWAITGSNGKTQVKEWLTDLVADWVIPGKTPGSFNSQLGVPLSVLGLQERHPWAVMEAGISKSGEMENIAQILQPDLGLLVHFGPAHREGFEDEAQKLREKLKLFVHSHTLVARLDVVLRFPEVWREHIEKNKSTRFVFWEFQDTENLRDHWITWKEEVLAKNLDPQRMMLWVAGAEQDRPSHMTLSLFDADQAETIEFESPNSHRAVLENMTGTALLLRAGGEWRPEIGPRFASLRPLPMRLEIRELPGSSRLINDSYSLDKDSLKLALEEWSSRRGGNQGVIVLSEPDIARANPHIEPIHTLMELRDLLVSFGWETLILVGKLWEKIQFSESESTRVFRYESTEALLQRWPLNDLRRLTVLVKGSRKFAFERIEQRLLVLGYQTVLEIDLEAAKHNFRLFKSSLQPGVRVMVMVKARAYGSGSIEIARAMEEAGADYLAVAYAGEGLELRNEGIRLPIMVMNSGNIHPEALLKANLEPDLYDCLEIQNWIALGRERSGVTGEPVGVHLQLDTGMRRLGISLSEHTKALDLLQTAGGGLRVRSIYTHLTSAEDGSQDAYSQRQWLELQSFADRFQKQIGYRPLIHALNTAGILRFPDFQGDMVRLGLGLYGLEPTGILQAQLKPLTKFKTVISQIHWLRQGDRIGYGNEGWMPLDGQVGVLPVGYADGLRRALGLGKITLQCKGRPVPTIGRISMDFCLVYLGDMDVEIGDEVSLFGEPGTIEEWAKTCDTIPYEILTSISDRVQRVYTRG